MCLCASTCQPDMMADVNSAATLYNKPEKVPTDEILLLDDPSRSCLQTKTFMSHSLDTENQMHFHLHDILNKIRKIRIR